MTEPPARRRRPPLWILVGAGALVVGVAVGAAIGVALSPASSDAGYVALQQKVDQLEIDLDQRTTQLTDTKDQLDDVQQERLDDAAAIAAAQAALAATPAPAATQAPSAVSGIPRPDAQQEAVLLAYFAEIDMALVGDDEKVVSRARNQCSSILGGASEESLISTTKERFEQAPDFYPTDEDAAAILAGIRASGFCV